MINMPKQYKQSDHKPTTVEEPAVAYHRMESTDQKVSSTVDWNPNRPVHATQEEWWEHIHQIEEGEFYPISEVHQHISQWLDNQKM
jgi:hypothetical protein